MGGGHGHGHGPPYVVPDYKIYKVEDVPELIAVRDRLAEKGLKDPWLRNEVWRYNPEHFPSQMKAIKYGIRRGVGTGLVLLGLTILYTKLTEPKKEHHEGDAGHH